MPIEDKSIALKHFRTQVFSFEVYEIFNGI